MRLDLSPLQRAIAQLEGALGYHDSGLARRDEQLRKHLRAAAIQAFEFTYELSHGRGGLRGHSRIPRRSEVPPFGSRARWTTHAGSDLDLAVDAGRSLSRPEVARLRDDLAESDLPYEVDVVDLHHVSESFRQVIERDRVPMPEPGTRAVPR